MGPAGTDEINPAYDKQDGYEGRYPPDWAARKKAVRQRDDDTCTNCGAKSGHHTPSGEGVVLDVYHIEQLADGGSNRLSNLTTICIDCRTDRHDHDITEGRADDGLASSDSWVWLRRLVRYSLSGVGILLLYAGAVYVLLGLLVRYGFGGMGVLLVHTAALHALLTQSVGEPPWLAGGGYFVLLALVLALRFRSGQIAALYAVAGGVAAVLMLIPDMRETIPVSASTLVFTTFVPGLLAGAWWWRQR